MHVYLTRLVMCTLSPLNGNWLNAVFPKESQFSVITGWSKEHTIVKRTFSSVKQLNICAHVVFSTITVLQKHCRNILFRVSLKLFLLYSLWSHLESRDLKMGLIVFCNSALWTAACGGWLLHFWLSLHYHNSKWDLPRLLSNCVSI